MFSIDLNSALKVLSASVKGEMKNKLFQSEIKTVFDTEKLFWHCVDDQIQKLSPNSWIFNVLTMHGPKIAQINHDTGVHLTFDEIRLRTIRIAQNLQKRGLKPRQTIGLLTGNCDDLLPIFLASICMACPIVPFHPMLSTDEIVRILNTTKPQILFCDANTFGNSKEIVNTLNWDVKVFTFDSKIIGTESVSSLLLETGNESEFVPVEIDMANDLAGILCSSGTTGPSKCVCVSYSHPMYTLLNKRDVDSIFFDNLSIYWTVGVLVILESVYNGVTRIITSKSSLKNQLEIIRKYKITNLNMTPFELISLLKCDSIHTMDLSNVKSIITYGYKLPYTLVNDIQQHFPQAKICSSYGLTEIGGVASCSINNNFDNEGGSRLAKDCIAKILDNNGNRCGPNETGEILVKRSYKFQGYFNDAMATKAALDDEGFFRTGDIGHFNDNGLLFISDRKKNLLTTFYFDGWILPLEMEEVLIKMPEIKEVCVVGVTVVQDAYLPAAVVVRQPGSKLNQNDVFVFAAKHFPHRAKLRGGVYFVDELPKTHNGKLLRKDLTELADKRFQAAKMSDPELQSYFADIRDEFRMLIFK